MQCISLLLDQEFPCIISFICRSQTHQSRSFLSCFRFTKLFQWVYDSNHLSQSSRSCIKIARRPWRPFQPVSARFSPGAREDDQLPGLFCAFMSFRPKKARITEWIGSNSEHGPTDVNGRASQVYIQDILKEFG